MRVAILNSGGKDSASCWWWAMCRGWSIEHIVTVVVDGDNSHMFQIPGVEISKLQADLARIPYHEVRVSGKEEEEITQLEQSLTHLRIDGIVVGALRSDYQKSRLEQMSERLDIKIWTPLWHQDATSHVEHMIEHGFHILLSGVSCEGLDQKWVGAVLNRELFDQLKTLSRRFRFNIDGEGGEYETIVLKGPHLPGRISLDYSKQWDGKRGEICITGCSIEQD